ncbi:DUF523 domain-containing protein [Enterobacter ludwigii]|nr:DUF523 domain-containing protein [Enterobacter ludwigii]
MPVKEIILLSACLSGHLVRYNGTDKSCSSDLLQHWRDVTQPCVLAAWLALKTAQSQGCRFAIMTDGSPTCGSQNVYDRASGGMKVPSEGGKAKSPLDLFYAQSKKPRTLRYGGLLD